MYAEFEGPAVVLLFIAALAITACRVWLVRVLAPAQSWPRAILAAGGMQLADVVLSLLIGSTLARLGLGIPIYAAALMLVYGRSDEPAFSFFSALTLAALCAVLHGLVVLGAGTFAILLGAEPAFFGVLLLAGVLLALGIRWLTAWRARALLTRMQEAGAGEGPSEPVAPAT